MTQKMLAVVWLFSTIYLGAASIQIVLPRVEYWCGEIEQQQAAYLKTWATSPQALTIRRECSLGSHDAAFSAFLDVFVSAVDVKALLDRRVIVDFAGRKAGVGSLKRAEFDAIKQWYSDLNVLLEAWGARLHPNKAHECPGTAVISFSAFPEYVVKMRAWGAYVLGFYDAEGRSSVPVDGEQISSHLFPFQVLSRVLYACEVNAFVRASGITNIRMPQKWVYVLPWASDEALDDASSFVVAEKINFDESAQEALLQALKEPGDVVTLEWLLQKAQNPDDQSTLANLVRVALGCGLFDFTPGSNNVVFCGSVDNPQNIVAVVIDSDRPAFGGGDPLKFFHQDAGEVLSNGRAGIESLVDMFAARDLVSGDLEVVTDQDIEGPQGP